MAQMPKKKKIPERKCLGCGESFPKSDLIRVVRAPDGSVSLDFKGKAPGRGAYICRNKKCLEKALKAKRIGRSLEVELPDEIISSLLNEFSEEENG